MGFNEKRTEMSSHILVFCSILKSTFKCSASICYSKRDFVRKLDLFTENSLRRYTYICESGTSGYMQETEVECHRFMDEFTRHVETSMISIILLLLGWLESTSTLIPA